jgi:hypothetical protein
MRSRPGLTLALLMLTGWVAVATAETPAVPLLFHPGDTEFDQAPDSATVESPPGKLRRVGRTVGNFGSDVWYVFSSPARMNRKGFFYTVGFLTATGVLYAYDEEISDAFHRSVGDPFYDAVITIGDFIEPVGHMGKTNPFYVAGAIVGTGFSIPWLQTFTYEVLESHMISGGIRNAAKYLIGRRRPNEGYGSRFLEFNGGTSFPSGHASVIFELATILSHYTNRRGATMAYYGLAGCLAAQRIDSNQHWPSDVFLSAVTGTLVARVVVHRNEERRGKNVPVLGFAPWQNGVMVTYRF